MKLLLMLITVLVSITSQAQYSSPSHKISVGFSFSPDYNFRTLKVSDGTNSPDLILDMRNRIEIPKFGYTTGMNLTFHLSDNIGIETGIQYSNKGFKIKDKELIANQPDPNFPQSVSIHYSYRYIGIPVKAKFTFGKNRLRFTAGAGITANYLIDLKQTDNYKYTNGETKKKKHSLTSEYQKIDIASMFSIGVDYRISDDLHFIAEPTFRYGLIQTQTTRPIKEHLWNAGLNTGFYFSFK